MTGRKRQVKPVKPFKRWIVVYENGDLVPGSVGILSPFMFKTRAIAEPYVVGGRRAVRVLITPLKRGKQK